MDIFINKISFEAPERLTKEFLNEIEREFDMKYFDLIYEDKVMREGDDIFPGEYFLIYSDIKKRMSRFESIDHAQKLWFRCTDPKDVLAFLEYGIDINSRNHMGETLLISYISLCKPIVDEMTDILIKSGTDIKITNSYGDSCLTKAISIKNEILIEKLINKGADVNSKNVFGFTPLFAACQCRCPNITEKLIKAGAYIEDIVSGHTPLYITIVEENNECFDVLLKYGADIYKKIKGLNMIGLAKCRKNRYALKKLLEEDKKRECRYI